MGIFNLFNIESDIKELKEWIKEFWEWNAILVKRHCISLLFPIILLILSIFFELIMLYIINRNINNQGIVYYRIIAIIFVAISFLWYFYSIMYITKAIKNWINARQKFYEKTKDLTQTKKRFKRFIKFSIYNFITHFTILALNIILPFVIENYYQQRWSARIIFNVILLDIFSLIFLHWVLFYLIWYELSFFICSKDWITINQQNWFFWNNSVSLSNDTIKILKSEMKWLRNWIFKVWKITIISDSDIWSTRNNNINIDWISNPTVLVKKLNTILWK